MDDLAPVAPPRFSAEDISAAYRVLLGRAPESLVAIEAHQTHGDIDSLLTAFVQSPEFQSRRTGVHPYEIFATSLDARAIILSHAPETPKPQPGCVVNYLGVATDTAHVSTLAALGGTVEPPPLPSNFHAEMVEWAAVLRAVDLAKERFTIVELGAGWGCWMVNTAVAARRRGLSVFAVGVEGDAAHVGFMREHCARNGLLESERRVMHAVIGPKSGAALFPAMPEAERHYGQEPRFFASHEEAAAAALVSETPVDIRPAITMDALTADLGVVDLLHVDIQGGEADLLASCLPTIARNTRYIVVGTHGRLLDGAVCALMGGAGWVLEFEKPSTFDLSPGGEMRLRLDGTQGWRNPRL